MAVKKKEGTSVNLIGQEYRTEAKVKAKTSF